MTTIFGIDLQLIISVATMGAGVFVGWIMAKSHYIQAGWQFCSCPEVDCPHCTKDYQADAHKILDEALSGCDVHHDMEKA